MSYIVATVVGFYSDSKILKFLGFYIPAILIMIFCRYFLFSPYAWLEFQTDYSWFYYLLPMLLTICGIGLAGGEIKKVKFWIFTLSALLVVQTNQFFRIYKSFFTGTFSQGTATFFLRLIYNAQCTLTYLLIPLLFHFFATKKYDNFWGLNLDKPILKPYINVFLFTLPFLWLASTSEHFRNVYPLFLTSSPDILNQFSLVQAFFLFQILYVLQFITLELFFRGYLVLKGQEYLGKYTVFLMSTLYVLIHLEAKPLAESLGSLFGALILGALAYQTRQIWGGILVHVGIALSMELLALI